MSIQANSAIEKNIELKAVFNNISDNGTDEISSDYSPLIYSDEHRIMQVLLGLQSNALKFTRNGSVTIFVEI
jgi:signal transduction histidine kinase